jgi:hypothetical protein
VAFSEIVVAGMRHLLCWVVTVDLSRLFATLGEVVCLLLSLFAVCLRTKLKKIRSENVP